MRKGRGISIQQPFGPDVSVPERIDEARLVNLTKSLRAGQGTEAERHEIAFGFMRLAVSIAGKYAASRPEQKDDLVSCAMFGLVKAIDEAFEKLRDDNITPYIVSVIHSHCNSFQEKERLYGASPLTRWRHKQAGLELRAAENLPLENVDEFKIFRTKISGDGTLMDLCEILEMSIYDEVDQIIIDLRIEGYTDLEIAEQLECSNSYVYNRRQEIKKRFERLENVDVE